MIGRQLEIGADLAERVEGIFVEEAERPLRHRFHLLRKDAGEGADRVFAGTPGEVKSSKPRCGRAQMCFIGGLFRKPGKFRIRQERRIVLRQMLLE